MRLASGDRVLVRVPSWLGDLVMAEPALRALHAFLEPGRLALAGPRHLLPLLDGAFERARRVPHDGRGGERVADWRGHDVALLLTGSFRSAWTAWRAGVAERVGLARDGRRALLTVAARPALERGGVPVGLGRVGRRPRVLPRPFGATAVELLGLVGLPVADTRPRLAAPEHARARSDAWLRALGVGPGEPFLLANVGSRPGSAKGLPGDLWVGALEGVARETALPVVLVCGPGEEAGARELGTRLRASLGGRVLGPDATGGAVLALTELVAACERASLVLTSDSGPRHVAVAAGAPVVCVAGPTDPRHTADHLGATRVVRTVVPCGPCHREACPLDGDRALACVHRIDPARVASAAVELLREHPDPRREPPEPWPASSPSSPPTSPTGPSS